MVRVMEFEMRVLAYVKIRIRVLFWQSSSAFEMAGLSAIADNRIICRPTAGYALIVKQLMHYICKTL